MEKSYPIFSGVTMKDLIIQTLPNSLNRTKQSSKGSSPCSPTSSKPCEYSNLFSSNNYYFDFVLFKITFRSQTSKRFSLYFRNPTPDEDKLLENIIWPKVNVTDFAYLDIGSYSEVKFHPREPNYHEWEAIYYKYGVPPYDTY